MVAAAAVLTAVGLVVFWPHGGETAAQDPALVSDHPLPATVTGVQIRPCSGTAEGDGIDCAVVSLRLDGDAGPATLEQSASATGPRLGKGDEILVVRVEQADGSVSYSFYDFQRSTPMWILTLIFVGAVLLLGR